MSIASNFPAISPSLSLDFAAVQSLDPRITFTRASTATYYGTETAKAEENLLLYSQEFDNGAFWGLTNATVTANTEVAPDGTTTAETLTDDATNGVHLCTQNISLQVDTPFTFSCFLKEGTNTHAYLSIRDAATSQRYFAADFNLDTGTVRTTGAGTSGTLTSNSITSVGNGWYRCVITGQVAAVGSMRAVIGVSDGATAFNTLGAISYIGTGTTIFVWGAQLEQRDAVTAYTPTTTQPITNYIPVLETAASGVARFDHNPTTFESLGLLIEESRTNLLLQSETFSTTWVATRCSITANTIVAPDGALTADKLVEDATASDTHLLTQSISFTSGTAYTYSIFAKQAEAGRFLQLLFPSAAFGSALRATFDLTNGTFQVSASITGAITFVGNGWYRCSITGTATTTASATIGILLANSSAATGAAAIYTGDGYSGIYIWGAQLEAGAFPTSYIPTVASQVTRAADAASMTGTNFSSWYNQGAGTLYAESRCPNGIIGNLNRIASLNDGTTSNRTEIDTGSGTATIGRITTNGTSQGILSAGSYTDFQLRKSALAIQVDNFTLAANTATTSDTSVLVPVVDRLMIGQSPSANSNYLNGTIKKLAYYPLRATNAQLQGLTS